MHPVIVIPVLEPGAALGAVIEGVRNRASLPILIVDDGSGPSYDAVFHEVGSVPGTTVVRYPVNRGKGAALRAGMARVLAYAGATPGVVTADGDGQHAPDDIVAVAEAFRARPDALLLGARLGLGTGAGPLPSRVGNRLVRWLFAAAFGLALHDTQTGLRAIPRTWLPELLRLSESRYDFETAMLLRARRDGVPIMEHPIRTIYGGPPSHFRRVVDSARIVRALARELLAAHHPRQTFVTAPAATPALPGKPGIQ